MQARLRKTAEERELSVQDLQLKFLIERLVARLFSSEDPPWVLKGGFAMELRYRPRARTTKDVDLTIRRSDGRELAERLNAVRQQLQDAASLDLGDHLEFRIGSAMKQLPGAPQGNASFPVEALLAGKTFGRFHIDVGFGRIENPFQKARPHEFLVTSERTVPGALAPARNAYHVSQILSWLASHRATIQDQQQRTAQIGQLMQALLRQKASSQ